jgi:hypothetical protein
MSRRRNLSDIIEYVVLNLDRTVTIDSVGEDDNGDQVLYCSDILYAQAGFTITINSVDYIIKDIDCDDETIVVSGDDATVSTGDFTLYEVFFFHGTPIEQGIELTAETDAMNKTPMIWLMEGYSEEFDTDFDNPVERESTFRMFALSQADFENFTTDSAKEASLKPMSRLMDMVEDAIELNNRLFNTDNIVFKRSIYSKFGITLSQKGVAKQLWGDKLAGVEDSTTIPIWKPDPCYPLFTAIS